MNQENQPGQKCPQCGKPVKPGMAFCEGCGARLGTGQQAGAVPPAAPPPVQPPSYTPPAATPPPAQPPNYPPPPHVAAPVQPMYGPPPVAVVHTVAGIGNNGLCITALVIGIVAAVFFWVPFFGIVLGILAVIFGAVGIPAAGKKGQAGKGMGIAGLVLGIVALGLNIVFIILVWGIFESVEYHYYNDYYDLIKPVFGVLASLL